MLAILAIVKACSVDVLAEQFADKFSQSIPSPNNLSINFLGGIFVPDTLRINNDFSLAQLHHATQTPGDPWTRPNEESGSRELEPRNTPCAPRYL